MRTYSNSIVIQFDNSETGNAGSGKLVTVFEAGTTTKALLFDTGLGALNNPVQADGSGNYTFTVNNGTYDIYIDYGLPTQTAILNEQISNTVDNPPLSPGDLVVAFENLDEAVNEVSPSKIFLGASLNLAGREFKNDGYGGMWDVYQQGTFPLGNNVISSNFLPLQLVKRKDSSVSTRSIAEAKTRFIAHRGISTIAPENTIAAYRLAANAGFWAGECDVQVTSDGQWVLMHDDTVDRTTNGTGLVKSMTLAQIKALDAGSWFSSYYTGETVPTLSEYLSLCKEKGLNPFIEIKTDVYTDADLVLLIDTLNQYFPDSSAIIATFDEDILLRIRGFDTKVNLQYFTLNYTNSAVDFAVRLGNCGIAVQQPGLGSDLSYAVENGIYVMVWTVNEFDTMNAALNAGASQILTDFILGEPS